MATLLDRLQGILHKLEVPSNKNNTPTQLESLKVLLQIEPVHQTHSFILEIIEIEASSKLTDGISIYQFFVNLDLDSSLHDPIALQELQKTFSWLNGSLAIGSLNILPNKDLCFFKYNLLIKKDHIEESLEKMVKTVWMVDAVLKSYTSLITKILIEDLSFQEALDRGFLVR